DHLGRPRRRRVLEEEELHRLGVLGVDAEVGAVAAEPGAEGEAEPREEVLGLARRGHGCSLTAGGTAGKETASGAHPGWAEFAAGGPAGPRILQRAAPRGPVPSTGTGLALSLMPGVRRSAMRKILSLSFLAL